MQVNWKYLVSSSKAHSLSSYFCFFFYSHICLLFFCGLNQVCGSKTYIVNKVRLFSTYVPLLNDTVSLFHCGRYFLLSKKKKKLTNTTEGLKRSRSELRTSRIIKHGCRFIGMSNTTSLEASFWQQSHICRLYRFWRWQMYRLSEAS